MDQESNLAQQLQALQAYYTAELPDKITAVEALWERGVQGPWGLEITQELLRLSHSLVGSGATFGFQAVSDTARDLETWVRGVLAAGARPDDIQRQEGAQKIAALKLAAQRPVHQDT